MSQTVSRTIRGRLLRGATIVAIAGFAAGCSSDVARFSDNFYTGSVPKAPPAPVTNPVYEPYPGDVADAPDPVDRTSTGSIARQASRPVDLRSEKVERSSLPTPGSVSKSALAPVAAVPNAGLVDPVVTGTVPVRPDPVVEAETTKDGWTRAGGTQVTLREGETIYNLSRRFGVPAKAIMGVNGITDPSKVHAGQKIIIPTYVYSSKSRVSAPDSNPNTASAKSSRGTRYDVPEKKAPLPTPAPKKEAILPKPAENRTSSTKSAANKTAGQNSASTEGSYTVTGGDTLWGIARRHGVGVAELRAANGIEANNIRVGQKLAIPAAGSTSVDATKTAAVPASGKSKPKDLPSYTPPRKTDKVIETANRQTTEETPEDTGVGSMRWPARGRVVSEYGERNGSKPNDGIDISVPSGTPVKAAENGIVIYAGDGLKDFGHTVLVRHEDGVVTVYGHNSALKVSRGERVRRGQEIARSGMSGQAESPRLHFEVRKNSVPVNPMSYLK